MNGLKNTRVLLTGANRGLTPDEYGAQVAGLMTGPSLLEGEAIGFHHGRPPVVLAA